MLFSIVLRFGNTWFLLCLEWLDADWLNGYASCEILVGVGGRGVGQICQVKSA